MHSIYPGDCCARDRRGPFAVASVAGTRWALIGPGLAILACGAALTLRATPEDAAAKDGGTHFRVGRDGREPESGADTAARSGEKGHSPEQDARDLRFAAIGPARSAGARRAFWRGRPVPVRFPACPMSPARPPAT